MSVQVNESERRWLYALLVMSTLTVGLLLLGLVANILAYFTDILLIFLLAWLLAFAISPIVSAILRAFPTLPRGLVVIFTYVLLFFIVSAATLMVAGSLAVSIAGFLADLPTFQSRLPQILAPWQEALNSVGLQVDLVATARGALQGLGSAGGGLLDPLTDLAVASLGVVGNLLLVVFLSLFIVIDRDRIMTFFNRLVPPRYKDEARLFETSVASSFGGFMRGQAIQGVIYGAIAAVAHLLLGLDFMPASVGFVVISQTIPFFGPFFSWAPPVLIAVFTRPDAVIPAAIIMAIGWFVVMNIVQPRVMATAIGIHPIVVLASVLVGLKVAGIAGAIFGMPIAAIMSSFFFHYLNRSAAGGPRDVTSRAAKRLEQREGRHIRIPTAPPLPPSTPTAGAAPIDTSTTSATTTTSSSTTPPGNDEPTGGIGGGTPPAAGTA